MSKLLINFLDILGYVPTSVPRTYSRWSIVLSCVIKYLGLTLQSMISLGYTIVRIALPWASTSSATMGEVRLISCLPNSDKKIEGDFLVITGNWHLDELPCPISWGKASW